MNFYNFNFKKILIVLSEQGMRDQILKRFDEEEIDAKIKFVDGYFEAAGQIQTEQFDMFDYIIVNQKYSNKKLKDFLEFVLDTYKEDQVIDFSQEF